MANPSAGALAPAQQQQVATLRSVLETDGVRTQLSLALPKHLTVDRVVRQTMTMVQKNPGLLDCTQTSILSGLIQASELGLELAGPLGQAYLVPRYNGKLRCKEAVFQIGYRGLMDLGYRSAQIRNITPRIVYENEAFEVRYGTHQEIRHSPNFDNPGAPSHFYATVQYVNGGCDFEVMSVAQVKAHRQKYSPPPANGNDYSAWATNFDAMALKTVLRKLCKRVPVSIEMQRAAMMDEYNEGGVDGLVVPALTVRPGGAHREEAQAQSRNAAALMDAMSEPREDNGVDEPPDLPDEGASK